MKRFFYTSLLLISLVGIVSCDAVSKTETNSTQNSEVTTENQQTEQPLVVIAYLNVKPEDRDTFLELATQTAKATNETEPGVNSYFFYEDQNTPNLFFFFEEWKTQAAFEAHLEQPHTQELTAKYAEILAQPADVRIYTINEIQSVQVP
ncbi:MAG: putative quinol monooxygenase [Microcoleaceae cyanobacterium]